MWQAASEENPIAGRPCKYKLYYSICNTAGHAKLFISHSAKHVSIEWWRTRGNHEEVDKDLQRRSWRRSSHWSQILSATIPQGASRGLNSECFRHVQHTRRRKTAVINARAGYGMRVVHDFAIDCGNCREVIFKIENHQDLSTIYYVTGTLRWSGDHQHRTRVR